METSDENTNPMGEQNKDGLNQTNPETSNDGGMNTPPPVPMDQGQSMAPSNNEGTNNYQQMFSSGLDLGFVNEKVMRAKQEIAKNIIGQTEMIDLLLIGIFSNGHILLEGVPGIAKTLTAKVLAKTLSVDFSRIQFTPDLMPSDVLGTSVFNMKDTTFSFKKGPIFSNIVLIDEINRAPAKTQASLFEVMEERQITYDGQVYPLEFPFLVIATQNPVEQEGTYSLPEAQLDRFLFKINMTYPTLEEEMQILTRYKNNVKTVSIDTVQGVFNAADVQKIQDTIEQIRIEEQLIKYIAEVTDKTRNHGKLYLGGSPRASLSMLKASKAYACIRGRDFVIPDDIQFVAPHILNHRMILTPEAEMEGVTVDEVIKEILHTIEVPR
jgi:MoxR-like ATPase